MKTIKTKFNPVHCLNNKKAQSATEYLMTYGWAILILTMASIAAWQMGFFDFTGPLTPGYSGFWGVVPQDYKVTTDGTVELILTNNVGGKVNVSSVNVTIMGFSQVYQNATGLVINPGDSVKVNISDGEWTGEAGMDFWMEPVIITYTDARAPDTAHTSSGRIWGAYE